MVETHKLKKQYRPSFERVHAPYRGVSSREDFTNSTQAIKHNLVFTQIKSGAKKEKRGHKQQIEDNFTLLYKGEGEEATASLPTAGTYTKVVGPAQIVDDLTNDVWTPIDRTVKKGVGNKIQISESGVTDPAGVTAQLPLNLTDILYVRFKMRKVEGACDAVYLGTEDLNFEGPSFKHLELTNEFQWFDARFYSNQSQILDFIIYLHKDPSVLEKTTIEIEDIQFSLLEETECQIKGLSSDLNRNLRDDRQTIDFLRKNVRRED